MNKLAQKWIKVIYQTALVDADVFVVAVNVAVVAVSYLVWLAPVPLSHRVRQFSKFSDCCRCPEVH